MTSNRGRPRNTSTYTVPSRRSGNANGPRVVRITAMVRLTNTMATAEIAMILTFIHRPAATAGKESTALSQLK